MSISLKISLVDLGTIKMNQYPTDMYIIDVCKDIRAKFNYGEGGLDHGLLFKDQGLWLAPNKMLGHYDLKFGDVLEFRKKHRILKVKTLDGNVKNILFDESITVKAIVEVISQRIGLANGDEYSLMRDNDAQSEAEKEKEKEKNEKKKKHDKDAPPENNWLNPDKTLREQGLTEEDCVVLKKKFFVTDQNVDRTDPVQLVIMHAQAHKDIISGKLPCTSEEAAQFGGIMMQIMYGNQDPTKHKPGFAKMKDLVPAEYAKNKEVEKNIYKEHSILQGTTELNAKFRYVQLIRSLKTYGTTFFIVNEPADKAKKKKAQQVLLGITKNSVVRMDIETKNIISEWKLTQLRNWSASTKTFTIDLGDHDTKYYQVETKEGEEIARLLSGYVEIIVKRRNMLMMRPKEQNMEEHAVVEEYVKPGLSRNVAAVTISSASQAKTISTVGSGVAADFTDASKTKRAKAAIAQDLDEVEDQELLLRLIRNGIDAVEGTCRDLQTPMSIPIGADAASVKWREDNLIINAESLSGHIGNLLAAIGSLIQKANGDTKIMDYDQIRESLTGVVSDTAHAIQSIRVLANLSSSDEDHDELMQAGGDLTETVVKLFKELQPVVTGHQVLTEFHNSGTKVAHAGSSLLIMTDKMDVPELNQSEIMDAAGEVSSILLQVTKPSLESFKNPTTKKLVAKNLKAINEATGALVTISGILSSVVTNPYARDQLVLSAVHVRDVASEVKEYCNESSDKDVATALLNAVEEAEQALEYLVDKVRNIESSLKADIQYYHDQILETAEIIRENIDIPQELFASAKEITIFGARLTETLKQNAELSDAQDDAAFLNNTANAIAELMAQLVSATKETLSDSSNVNAKDKLLDVTTEICDCVSKECAPYVKASMLQSIITAFKATISCSNQVIASGRQAGSSIRDRSKISKLTKAGKAVIEKIPSAIKAINDAKFNPYELAPRLKLVESAKEFIDPILNLIAGVSEAVPHVSDKTRKVALLSASEKLDIELENLSKILDVYGSSLSDVDFKAITEAFKNDGSEKIIEPVSIDVAEIDISNHGQLLSESIRNITDAFSNSDKESQAKAIASAFAEFQCIRSDIMRIEDGESALKNELTAAVGSVGDVLTMFMQKIVKAEIESHEELNNLSNNSIQSVNNFLNHLPRQRAIIDTMGTLKKLGEQLDDRIANSEIIQKNMDNVAVLSSSSIAQKTEPIDADIEVLLLAAATDLSACTQSLINGSKYNRSTLKGHIETLESNYGKLIQASASLSKNDPVILNSIHNIALETYFFSNTLQSSMMDKSNQGLLIEASKSVGDAVNGLMGIFANSNRGLDDCTKALQVLNSVSSITADINGARRDQYAYADIQLIIKGCHNQLVAKTDAILRYIDEAKVSSLPASMLETCTVLHEFVARSIDGAHILAAADPESIPAIPSKINQEGILRAIKAIKVGANNLHQPSASLSSAFSNTTVIAKNTADLCNLCNYAGEIEENLKDYLDNHCRELASISSSLVSQMKKFAVDGGIENESKLGISKNALVACLDKIELLCKNPEYLGQPLKPSIKVASLQKLVLDNCTLSIQEARNTVSAIQALLSPSQSNIDLEDIISYISRLCEATFTISNLLNETSPASADFNVAEASLVKSKVEISKTIEKLQQGEKLIDNGIDLTTFNKSLTAVGEVVDELLKYSETQDIHSLQQNLMDLPERIKYISSTVEGVVAQAKSESQKPILLSVDNLFSSLITYLRSVQSQCLDPNEIRLFNLKNESFLIHKSVADSVNQLKEAETVDPAFSSAIQIVEEKMVHFEKITDSSNNEKENVALGLTAKTLAETEKLLVAVLTEAVTEKNVDDYGRIATETSQLFAQITDEVANIRKQSIDPLINDKLTNIVKDLGDTTSRAVVALKQGTKSGDQVVGRTKVTEAIKELGSIFVNLEEVKKDLVTGILACEQVTAQVSDIQNELKTSLLFAQAKQLNPATEADNFAVHKNGLLTNAQKLTEIFKDFVNANSLDQETLGTLVTSSAEAMKELKTKSILAATSLSSADYATQQELIASTLQVGEAMKKLIEATSTASGCKEGKEVAQLNKLIDNQFDVVSQLVNVVKELDNPESSRNFEAYQNIIEAIKGYTAVLHNSDPALGTALPDELVLWAQQLANSMANLAEQADTESDKLPLLNQVQNDVEALCRAGKAISANAPPEKATLTLGAVSKTCISVVEILESIQQFEESGRISIYKNQIEAKSKHIISAVDLVVEAAKNHVPEGYVDVNDPNVIAERELLLAASSIEAAARSLLLLSPISAPPEENDELKFEDQIVLAAKGIAAATSALVRSATSVQREIAAKGKINKNGESAMYFSDGTWNEGLISAANLVVNATTDLCQSANSFVRADCEIERVTVSAKNVSSSTIQLLSAASVRSDPNSQFQIRLRSAGKAVSLATDQLVIAAQNHLKPIEGPVSDLSETGLSSHKAKIKEMEIQMKILRLEKELQEAREQLASLRKLKYKAANIAVVSATTMVGLGKSAAAKRTDPASLYGSKKSEQSSSKNSLISGKKVDLASLYGSKKSEQSSSKNSLISGKKIDPASLYVSKKSEQSSSKNSLISGKKIDPAILYSKSTGNNKSFSNSNAKNSDQPSVVLGLTPSTHATVK